MIITGDCLHELKQLESESVHCCVTSPPYWGLRCYGVDGQLGLEKTPDEFVSKMVDVFREVRRVLRDDGSLWLNLGDSYCSSGGAGWQGKHGARASRTHTQRRLLGDTRGNGLKSKDLVGIPWRVAFALQADGWYLRQDIIWHKPNPMPESVRDRCTKAHEYIFLLSKSPKYHFDIDAIKETAIYPDGPNAPDAIKSPYGQSFTKRPGPRNPRAGVDERGGNQRSGTIPLTEKRNKRSVWTVSTEPTPFAHFATFPTKLIEPCILAGCPEGGVVLDPFFGSGTVGLVAQKNFRKFIGIELNPEYVKIAEMRTAQMGLLTTN